MRQPTHLHQAMRHAMFGGGKRIRPVLCVLVAEASGGKNRPLALEAGCAIEMVHTASLILDDLPSMDDATLRRGQPTTHMRFGEATAILAAIGLLNRAFSVVAEYPTNNPDLQVKILEVLSHAIGSDGMIAGQEIDLHQRAAYSEAAPIENLNWLKTGVLFVASAHIGAICGELGPERVDAVKQFAKHVGIAFQTADDLVDQTSTPQTAGKNVHQDDGIPTLVTLCGRRAARQTCQDHLHQADDALQRSGVNPRGLQGLVQAIFASRL